MRSALATSVVAMFLVAIGAFALPSAGSTEPLTVTVGTLARVGSLDRRHGDSDIAREVWNLQYPTLTALDPKTLDPAPGIAVAWTPAPHGQGWVYKLRTKLTWSDGKPLTAADVVYSLDHARDDRWPGTAPEIAGLSARAVNEHTVEITSTKGTTVLPGILLTVVPAHVYASNPDLGDDVAQLGVADGTWHVTAVARDSVTLDANGAGGPPVQRIVFRSYPNADALIAALDHGEVDAISDVPDTDVAKLEALQHVTVVHAGDGDQYVLVDASLDPDVRKAVSLAIDRDALVTEAVHGVGTPEVVPIAARGASWALDDTTVQSLTASLDDQPGRARELLAGVLSSDKTLTIQTSTDDGTDRAIERFVERALDAVGITTHEVNFTLGGNREPELLIAHMPIAIDPFPTLRALTIGTTPSVPRDYSAQLAEAHTLLGGLAGTARVIGLFQPDTLQAFRSDHITGWLPEPQQRSLVVFGPTVAQYGALSAANAAPAEKAGNGAYAVGAVIVLLLCGGVYWIAARVRRRYVTTGENDVSN